MYDSWPRLVCTGRPCFKHMIFPHSKYDALDWQWSFFMCVGTVRTSIKQWSFQGLNHSLFLRVFLAQFYLKESSKRKHQFPSQGYSTLLYHPNKMTLSLLAYTYSTVVLALLSRPLSVFYRLFAHQLCPYSKQPRAPTILLGGALLTPGQWPPVCWGEAQIYGPVSAKSPAHTCAIGVLAVHKTWTQDWRFHLTRIAKKLPGSKS